MIQKLSQKKQTNESPTFQFFMKKYQFHTYRFKGPIGTQTREVWMRN